MAGKQAGRRQAPTEMTACKLCAQSSLGLVFGVTSGERGNLLEKTGCGRVKRTVSLTNANVF